MPGAGVIGQDMRLVAQLGILRVGFRQVGRHDLGITAVAVSAAEHHSRRFVHGPGIAGCVAGFAAVALRRSLLQRLHLRRGRRHRPLIMLGMLVLTGQQIRGAEQGQRSRQHQHVPDHDSHTHINNSIPH